MSWIRISDMAYLSLDVMPVYKADYQWFSQIGFPLPFLSVCMCEGECSCLCCAVCMCEGECACLCCAVCMHVHEDAFDTYLKMVCACAPVYVMYFESG